MIYKIKKNSLRANKTDDVCILLCIAYLDDFGRNRVAFRILRVGSVTSHNEKQMVDKISSADVFFFFVKKGPLASTPVT